MKIMKFDRRFFSPGRLTFCILNTIILTFLALICVLPLIHVLAVSFSDKSAVSAGFVTFWPVKFTLESYKYILKTPAFLRSVGVTLERVVIGLPLSLLLTMMTAYALSKDSKDFRGRTFYAWFFIVTTMFGGGLIPFYMTIKFTGIMDTIWALVLPTAVQVFNVVLMLNFFRGLPKEIEESAFVDGAGYWTALWRIVVPISTPSIATVALFTFVSQWNAWFDGLLLMNSPNHYPLQSYLQAIISQSTVELNFLDAEDWKKLAVISDRTVKSSQIFLGALPILLIYPFLQRYFVKGIVLGSVKG